MMMTRSNPTLRDLLTFVFQEHNASTVDIAQRLAIPYQEAKAICARLAAGTDATLVGIAPDTWACRTAVSVSELDELLLTVVRRAINLNQLLLPETPQPLKAIQAPAGTAPETVIAGIVKSLAPAQQRALKTCVDIWAAGERVVQVLHPSKVNDVPGAANVAALQALERRGHLTFKEKQPNAWTLEDIPDISVSVAAAIAM